MPSKAHQPRETSSISPLISGYAGDNTKPQDLEFNSSMTTIEKHGSYVALIGAYERDNFGDILFLKVCKKLLPDWRIVPLSLISRNMRNEGGGEIVSASAWFDCCKEAFLPKAIIVVGGEVLTCTAADGLACDIDPKRSASFCRSDESIKKRLANLVSWHAGDFAYIPDLNKILGDKRHTVSLALNSVGGSSLEPSSQKFSALFQMLDQASYISVRDAVTQKLIIGGRSEGELANLNPDIVSTLRTCCAPEVETAYRKALFLNPWLAEPYLLFQANDEFIRSNGSRSIATQIAATAASLNLRVVFQPAGVATAHDSFEMLDELARLTKALSTGDIDVQTQHSRDVWTQVAVIANAACYVGTSLHGRIVAAAYGTPRVGLTNGKVSIYASTWEKMDLQPFNIPIEQLKTSVDRAINTSPERLSAHANGQAQLALDGFEHLKQSLNLQKAPQNDKDINEDIEYFTGLARFRETEILRNAVIDLGHELSKEQDSIRLMKDKLSALERNLSDTLQSPSWRLTKPLRALHRLISRV